MWPSMAPCLPSTAWTSTAPMCLVQYVFIVAKSLASPKPRNHDLARHPYHRSAAGDRLNPACCSHGIHRPRAAAAAVVGVSCRLLTIGRKYKFLRSFYLGTIFLRRMMGPSVPLLTNSYVESTLFPLFPLHAQKKSINI